MLENGGQGHDPASLHPVQDQAGVGNPEIGFTVQNAVDGRFCGIAFQYFNVEAFLGIKPFFLRRVIPGELELVEPF